MLFMPSKEINIRMLSELSCVFTDRSSNQPFLWLVAKLPTSLIRAVWVGARVSLQAWVVDIEGNRITAFGLTIHDDEDSPCCFFGSCRSEEEDADLRTILASCSVPIQFHNENLLPLMWSKCRLDPNGSEAILNSPSTFDFDRRLAHHFRERANDVVQIALNRETDSRIVASCALQLTFEEIQSNRVHVSGIGDVNLVDSNQGSELERLTFQAFESMFPYGTFIGPEIDKKNKRRELCDVLAISRNPEVRQEGVFVIQSKVSPSTSEGLSKKTDRKAKTIQNNIMDGISQLEGAIKALKSGKKVFRKKEDVSIETDPPMSDPHVKLEPMRLHERANEIGQGIVLISEMHWGVDWEDVFRELSKIFMSTRYYCHVLDLQELCRLISYSKGRPAILEGMLLRRGEEMIKAKNANVRFHFIVDENARPPEDPEVYF